MILIFFQSYFNGLVQQEVLRQSIFTRQGIVISFLCTRGKVALYLDV